MREKRKSCQNCIQTHMRCSGTNPCAQCLEHGLTCLDTPKNHVPSLSGRDISEFTIRVEALGSICTWWKRIGEKIFLEYSTTKFLNFICATPSQSVRSLSLLQLIYPPMREELSIIINNIFLGTQPPPLVDIIMVTLNGLIKRVCCTFSSHVSRFGETLVRISFSELPLSHDMETRFFQNGQKRIDGPIHSPVFPSLVERLELSPKIGRTRSPTTNETQVTKRMKISAILN